MQVHQSRPWGLWRLRWWVGTAGVALGGGRLQEVVLLLWQRQTEGLRDLQTYVARGRVTQGEVR